jgi:hypothetical protein
MGEYLLQSMHAGHIYTYAFILKIMFQMGNVGPMQGQAYHYIGQKIPYGIERYQNETKRLYRVSIHSLTTW